MNRRVGFIFMQLLLNQLCGYSQNNLVALVDADSNFVRKHIMPNDVRLFYGGQGNNISLGTKREGDPSLNGAIYTNTNDYIGAGITYKWLDGDLSFSLPGTTYLKEERSNLTQFKLGLSYTPRKFAFRGYYQESKGVVVSGTENEFLSAPSLHEIRLGFQITYLFNANKYSYRASLYQSELQMKTAGSFMIRIEPFYRNLGSQSGSMIPAAWDVDSRFGEQTGLEYVRAPGILFMPGYGINFVVPNSRLFISPIIFGGVGTAFNSYESKTGKNSYTNLEYAGSVNLNMGYNGNLFYAKIQFNWSASYSPLNTAYFTSNNIGLSLWVGMRFRDIEKFIPKNF